MSRGLAYIKRLLSRFGAIAIRLKLAKFADPAYLSLTALLLAVATLYVGWHANLVYSNIQDATVYPYLFKNPQLHDIVLPGMHANILKFPLFWLQSVLPYTFTSLSLVNLSLLFLTVFGWCFLLAYVFGKRNLPLIFIVMAAILLGSIPLGLDLIETTIRNIEYPIGLGFVIVISRLLKAWPTRRSSWLLQAFIGLLLALSLAGDSFMLYGFIAPILIVIGIDWLRTDKLPRRYAIALGIVAGITLLGLVIRQLVPLMGLASYFPNSSNSILPIDSFGPSLAHASSQIFYLFGADVFNRSISAGNSLYFVNFVLLAMALAGIFSIMSWVFRGRGRPALDKRLEASRFVLAVITISFFTTLGAYIFSGLVLTRLPDGTFIDAANDRYITLLPFLLVAGVVFTLSRYHTVRQPLKFIVAGLLVLAIALSVSSIKSSRLNWDNYASARRDKIQAIVSAVEAYHIHQVVSDDSLGAPIRFWSHNKIKFASLITCNQYMPQGTRLSWRQPSLSPINTALVIDRTGLLSGCSDQRLQTIFGAPAKTEKLEQIAPPGSVEVWIYHYDIRQKLPRGR